MYFYVGSDYCFENIKPSYGFLKKDIHGCIYDSYTDIKRGIYAKYGMLGDSGNYMRECYRKHCCILYG